MAAYIPCACPSRIAFADTLDLSASHCRIIRLHASLERCSSMAALKIEQAKVLTAAGLEDYFHPA